MELKFLFLLICILRICLVKSGSTCPLLENGYPCFCSNYRDNSTVVMCSDIRNSSHLAKLTKNFKSLVVDRLVLLNTFMNEFKESEIPLKPDPKTKLTSLGMLPKNWLSEMRVRNLEIQNAKLNGYFLIDDALEGQRDFLNSIVIKHANLSGRLCSNCFPASGILSTSTRELRKVPFLELIDLSFNNIDIAEGASFPATLTSLTKLILSNNKITRVQENAFSNLPMLQYLDLSRNLISFLARKAFVMGDYKLQVLDLSYNSLTSLPADLFQSMNSLKEVRLNDNLLETLPISTWSRVPESVERVNLEGNFFVCNCSMSWISRQNTNVNMKLLARCAYPRVVEFQELRPTLLSFTNCNSRI